MRPAQPTPRAAESGSSPRARLAASPSPRQGAPLRPRRACGSAPILGALLAWLAPSCANLADDIHLAPLYSNLSSAGGGRESEALAGAIKVKRPRPYDPVNEWELHPLVCRDELGDGRSYMRFLTPFGTRQAKGDDAVTQVAPLVRYQADHDENGLARWRTFALPGLFWSEDSTRRVERAFFPFGGVIERYATYDEILFVLFPLYMRTKRDGGTFHHFLWPLFSFGRNGKNELDWHIWPLYGIARPGHAESGFVLWPFYLWSHERPYLPRELQPRRWMLWPFYGVSRVGTLTSRVVLWPFFGFASDKRSGFWSWDGPWPFVRIQRPGTSTSVAYRTRVWPLYSYLRSDGLESTWAPWPLFNQRVESYSDGSRRATSIVPFWQQWTSYDLNGAERGSFQKFWPLYQHEEQGESSRTGLPTLLPTWRLPDIDEHYAWIWELYTRERNGAVVRERSWGGLWRRESDEREMREYISGLWSRRKLRDGVATVRETSLLFGLVRWRTSTRRRGFELMWPALPGPGWPALRGE